MRAADWIVLAAYFLYVLWEGFRHGRANRNLDDYFRGTRSLRWWAVGLSVMATQASAITYIGTTGQSYASGMSFIQFYLAQPIVMAVLCATFVPFFYRANVFTAYEYLERRFDSRTRTLTSLLFLLSRGLAVSIVLYAPAIVLGVVFGWSEATTILVMGVTTILYTTAGGNKAVIMVDAQQMLLMFAGIFVAIGIVVARYPRGYSIADAIDLAGVTRKWNAIDLSLDLDNPYTLLSGLVGGFFLALSYFGCDQSQVQRYLTGRSLTESRLSLVLNAFLKVPMQFLILAIGVLMFVAYHFDKPPLVFNADYRRQLAGRAAPEYARLEAEYDAAFAERRTAALELKEARAGAEPARVGAARARYVAAQADFERSREKARALVGSVTGGTPSAEVNYVFPSFLIAYGPSGLLGLMLAVVFAAAMSTFSSEINSLASATIIDFYRRFLRPEGSDAHYLRVSRLATIFWGAFATTAALFAGRLGSLIEAVNKVGSYFYGPILGVFLLAFLVPRAGGTGALWGLILGEAAVFAVAAFTSISWLYYNVVGALAVLVVGTVLGLVPARPRA
jgi:SSS family transporter